MQKSLQTLTCSAWARWEIVFNENAGCDWAWAICYRFWFERQNEL